MQSAKTSTFEIRNLATKPLICSTKNYQHSIFATIDAIPEETWKQLACEQNDYFNKEYLTALEKNHPKISFFYLILKDKNKQACAIALLQIIDFELDTIKNNFEFIVKKLHNFTGKIPFFSSRNSLKILIIGNVFISGEHGIFIKEANDKKEVLKELSKIIVSFSANNPKFQMDAIIFKDFKNESLSLSKVLEESYFSPFFVEPNMKLQIQSDWHHFDDYLAALKTKFRVKAKKALQQSADLKMVEITLENCETQLIHMKELYQKVRLNAGFNLVNFNVATYKDLKRVFGEKYLLQSYWIGDKMVGFLSGMIHETTLDAHFVGIDYTLNKQYAIYQRMLYDYIAIAINKKRNILHFGRTASEIKSSVGAIPQDLTIYLRYKKRIANRILKLFLQRVQPTPFQQKFPFKNQEST